MLILSRASFDSSLLFLGLMALLAALLAARAVPAPHRIGRPGSQEYLELIGAVAGAALVAAVLAGSLVDLVPVLLLFLGFAALLCYFSHRLSMPGILWMATQASALVATASWGYLLIVETELPLWFETVAVAGVILSVVLGSASLVADFAREAILTHELWRLPVAAPSAPRTKRFKVSLHLPCYAEPPEVVKETMNRLAELDYDDFEVLVCDNNTKDEALWRPLEEHCAVLNRRLGREIFRFFHVAPLPGAKAGALNFCLTQMDQNAEIVGIIDADYQSRPDFLSRLVPFFEDPEIGYLQTPHDYRDYAHSDYLTACYWEYMPCNKVDWPGISEYGGAFTIGTMCLLRAEALRKAGGWAEWCLTEDSEVSVRLRAVGYRGLYFVETFGRGLIPETFDDYKKQRFRWTAGPVQQLRRYWKLFLPAPLAPRMPGWTKLLEVLRCVAPLRMLFGMICAVLGLAMTSVALLTRSMEPVDVPDVVWLLLTLGTLTSLVRLGGLAVGGAGVAALGLAQLRGEMGPIDVPDVFWGLLVLGLVTWLVRSVHRYRLSGCFSLRDMLRGEIARASLTWVVLLAGVAGLSKRPLAWRRTPKFAINSAGESPFAAAWPETMAGAACVALAALMLLGSDLWGLEFAALVAIGLAVMAVSFFCAPLMVALGIGHAARMAADARTARILNGEGSPQPA